MSEFIGFNSISSHFEKDKHINYFRNCLNCLPFHYLEVETNKINFLYFVVSALDILKSPDLIDKKSIIDFIYRHQLKSTCEESGFLGSLFIGKRDENGFVNQACGSRYLFGNLAMTYTALATLRILDDDFSRVDRDIMISSVKSLQNDDGSFKSSRYGESDMRFLYCACAISHLLSDWSGVDKSKAVSYIKKCFSFDGGVSLKPGVWRLF